MAKHASPSAAAFPLPASGDDARRRRVLRNHKMWATGLLCFMAVVFISCSWWQSQGTSPVWVGYVRAMAEAGMVGGLADWFAVTALFRYPMGLPIPHTAIIPRKKDQFAGALSEFVSENFLNADTITDKVLEAGIPERLGGWLVQPDNAERVSEQVGSFSVRIISGIDPADAQRVIDEQVIARLAEPTWAPLIGRVAEGLVEDGKVAPIVDNVVTWGRQKVDGMEESIVELIDERMPKWAPKFAKDLVGVRVYRELAGFMHEVDTDPNHEARQSVNRYIYQFTQDLQFDPDMITRVETIKGDVMGSRAVTSASSGLWEQVSGSLIHAATDRNSALRRKIVALCVEWGDKLVHDAEVRADLEKNLQKATRYAADNGAGEIVGIISETIQRWDGREASEKIELMVGKDLQFIRLNGTVVGALAGLTIYTVSQLLFS